MKPLMTPANVVLGQKLCLPCDLMFWAPPDKEVDDYTGDHHLACQHLKVTSDQMKARYNQMANSAGLQEGDRVWL